MSFGNKKTEKIALKSDRRSTATQHVMQRRTSVTGWRLRLK